MNQKRNKISKDVHFDTSEEPMQEETKEKAVAIDKDWKCQYCHEPCKLDQFVDEPFGYISEISNTRLHQTTLEKAVMQETDEIEQIISDNQDIQDYLTQLKHESQEIKKSLKTSRTQIVKKCGHLLHLKCRFLIKKEQNPHISMDMLLSNFHKIGAEFYMCPLCQKYSNTLIYPKEALQIYFAYHLKKKL